MSNKTVELAILKQALSDNPAPVKGVPIAISHDGNMWWYVLEDRDFPHRSVDDKKLLHMWLYRTAQTVFKEHKINIGVART